MLPLSPAGRHLLELIRATHVEVYGAGNLRHIEDLFQPDYHREAFWCELLDEFGRWIGENPRRSARERRRVIDAIEETVRAVVTSPSMIDDDFRQKIASLM